MGNHFVSALWALCEPLKRHQQIHSPLSEFNSQAESDSKMAERHPESLETTDLSLGANLWSRAETRHVSIAHFESSFRDVTAPNISNHTAILLSFLQLPRDPPQFA